MSQLSETDTLRTRWSLLEGLREGTDLEKAAALRWFAEAYWPAVYGYTRRFGHEPETARDLTQDFFHYALAGNLVDKADRARGRLRTFIMLALKRFLMNSRRKETSQKRGGGQFVLSLDLAEAEGWYGQEPGDHATPEVIFNRRWLASLLQQAISAVRTELTARGQGPLFERVLPYALSSARDRQGDESIAAARDGAERVATHRVRQQLRTRLLELVAELMDMPTEAAAREELHFLLGSKR